MPNYQDSHIFSSFFAPRGHNRMYALGKQLAQLYLSPSDRLIGVIGEAGSGKSALIRGMFPGLELTNDDDGVYIRPLPLLEQDRERGYFSPHTYHVDIRFENGFTQLSTLSDAIIQALRRGKRVVVEHFDLVYPLLRANANLLIGVGEQVLVARPNLFGPAPETIRKAVYESLPFRLMAHTAEDLCEFCMPKHDLQRCIHGDVRRGFVIAFPDTKPDFHIPELEAQVNDLIAQDLPVTYVDDNHVSIGGQLHPCTGPRIHVSRTGQIEGFHLLHHFIYDRFRRLYLLVGGVGETALENLKRLDDKHQRPGWE